MIGRWWAFRRDEAGSVAVLFAASLVLLLGVAALVIDLGHAFVVKREMQKAAEAGADAGAAALYPSNASYTVPQWANAVTAAVNVVQRNYVDGVKLSSFTSANVEEGFWDNTWTPSTTPAHLLGYLDPSGAYTANTYPAPRYSPAVKVSLTKTSASTTKNTGNDAPLATYLASVLGINTMTMHTSAVGTRYYVGSVPAGNAFPFAIPMKFFTVVNGVLTPNCGPPPATFTIGSATHNSSGGQWTSFEDNYQVGASVIKNFIDGGNDCPLSIGNTTYILNGEDNSAYNEVKQNCVNKTYMVAVVDWPNSATTSMPTGQTVNVVGFVGLKITAADNGSNPYVTCEWVPGYSPPGAQGNGPNIGDPTRSPKLVQ